MSFVRGLFIASVFALGCSPSSDAGGPSAPACQALVDQCAAVQMGCAIGADGSESCVACPDAHYADQTGRCQPIGGQAMTHAFPDQTVGPGGEVRGMCRSWTVGNDGEMWINAVEMSQDEKSHHSNWTFVPDDHFQGPDGIWPCKDRNYDQISAALAGGVLYAQSTQAVHEVQKFPAGVVVHIPAHARIISDIHLLNTTAQANTGHLTLTIYALPADQVTVKLAPFHVDYQGLAIPPQAQSRFSAECDLSKAFEAYTNQPPLALDVYYLLPHTHALGQRMFVGVLGGPNDGQMLLDVHGTIGEARGRSFDPPISMAGANGFRYGCEFDNPRMTSVHWGFGDQEMCEALGFAASPLAFQTNVSASNPDGSDGAILKFTGSCQAVTFPWKQ